MGWNHQLEYILTFPETDMSQLKRMAYTIPPKKKIIFWSHPFSGANCWCKHFFAHKASFFPFEVLIFPHKRFVFCGRWNFHTFLVPKKLQQIKGKTSYIKHQIISWAKKKKAPTLVLWYILPSYIRIITNPVFFIAQLNDQHGVTRRLQGLPLPPMPFWELSQNFEEKKMMTTVKLDTRESNLR